MTATSVATAPDQAPARATGPGLGRLTLVELRKTVDTRSGSWLLLATAALTAALTTASAFGLPDEERTLLVYAAVASVPASVLVPVVAILLVTSEWSQGTALVTFVLVPRRGRVLLAKLAASLVLAIAALPLVLGSAVVATAVAGSGTSDQWSFSAALVGQAAFSLATVVVSGVAFGILVRSSAPAVVLFFVLPLAWAALGSFSALNGAARWLDTTRTLSPLLEQELDAGQWARVGTSLALWLVLPLLVGAWRLVRRDVP